MTENPEKKIIVDEDWKGQVEREREAARKDQCLESAHPAGPSPHVELPPASLIGLASGLAFQATAFLGLLPDPASGKPERNLPQAKHLIDMLEMLQQKTDGNRTPEESEDLEAMLHQLRMAYVQVAG